MLMNECASGCFISSVIPAVAEQTPPKYHPLPIGFIDIYASD